MIHKLDYRAMGCRMQALVDTGDSHPPAILQEVSSWFEEWEQVLSRFRSDSELCQINGGNGSPFSVSQTLWDVFQLSIETERMSGGLVSPLILDDLVAAGYDRDFDRMFDGDLRTSFKAAPVTVSLSDFAVHPETRCLTLPDGCRLDFGGVAKGWAAQQAAIRLAAAGPALVNAGGDIAITGPRPGGESWPVGVADPFRPSMHLEILHLEGGGVATSGKDYRRWTVNGQRQHHLIDPRTGLPAESDVLAATVIAPTVMIAEALAKLVLLSGSAAGLHLLDGDPALAGVIVLENGQCLYSRTAEDYL